MLRLIDLKFPVIALMGAFALAACQPKYPTCTGDEQCSEHGEFCVNGQCQECSTNDNCETKYPGEKRTCNEGRCDAATKGCKTDTDCGEGQTCKANQCVASSCNADADCFAGQSCKAGTCTETSQANAFPDECKADGSSGEIHLQNVPFAFNEYNLTPEARQVLEKNISCLQKAGRLRVILEGHADERGTQEYNLALGDKRAHTVRNYLKTLGISLEQLQVRSKGENEPLCNDANDECFARNRRVSFISGH